MKRESKRAILTIGDVVQVQTARGLAYCQYTHEHEEWGSLIRALPGFFEIAPDDYSWVTNQKTQFKVFFPLKEAVERGLVEVVANTPVPDEDSDFPLFRVSGLPDPVTMIAPWSFWDGVSQWPMGKLKRKYRKLPIRQIVNDSALVNYLETEWRSERDLGIYRKNEK